MTSAAELLGQPADVHSLLGPEADPDRARLRPPEKEGYFYPIDHAGEMDEPFGLVLPGPLLADHRLREDDPSHRTVRAPLQRLEDPPQEAHVLPRTGLVDLPGDDVGLRAVAHQVRRDLKGLRRGVAEAER